MQITQKHLKLLRGTSDEKVMRIRAIAQCAAGLLIVLLLAVIGFSSDGLRDGNGTTVSTVTAGMRAEEHRKQVFDERRQRFQSNAEQRSVASQAVEPANQSPVVLR